MEDQLSNLEEELKVNIRIRVETNEKIKETIENINADLANKIQ